MTDAIFLFGLVAFTFGGGTAMHWVFDMGQAPLPRKYRERLRNIAWIPTAIAAGGLLMSAATSPLTALSPWLGIAGILLTTGLLIRVPTRPAVATTTAASPARHAAERFPHTLSTRSFVLGCGYMTGSLAWFVALLSEGGAT